MTTTRISDVITPHFKNFWVESKRKNHLKYVLKGGRGSGKSYHIPLRIAMDVMEFPVSALVVRKVQKTIAKSAFQAFKAATMALGVSHLFKFVISRLEITYLPRGNKVYFAGADDPEKIKSIIDAEFPLAMLWVEELAEFKTEEEIETIENSVLRSELEIQSEAKNRKKKYGFDYAFYYSYNPPKRKQSWVNKKYGTQVNLPKNVYVDHSTYFDNPHLSKKFVENAEETKAKSQLKYDWIYMGKPIGAGVVPFTNLDFRQITDEEIARFDNIKQGLDFGYAADPVAFVRMHLDKTRRRLYIFDELYGIKLSNREVAKWIIDHKYNTDLTIADSAEPKSIDEIKSYNVRIKGAKKGPGSIEHGEKWLDDLDAIIIDPIRCPNAAAEYEAIDYQVDKDGNIKNKLEDANNHTIDATRYGNEDEMKYKGQLKAAQSIY